MSFSGLIVQLLNGLASASSLFLVAAGLSLIFGVTRVVNFAHGSFYMVGIYGAYSLVERLGDTLGFWPWRCAGFRRCCGLFDRRGKPKNRLLTVWRWRSVATLCGCGWSQSAARWSLSQANCGGIKWPRSRRNSLKPCP